MGDVDQKFERGLEPITIEFEDRLIRSNPGRYTESFTGL